MIEKKVQYFWKVAYESYESQSTYLLNELNVFMYAWLK